MATIPMLKALTLAVILLIHHVSAVHQIQCYDPQEYPHGFQPPTNMGDCDYARRQLENFFDDWDPPIYLARRHTPNEPADVIIVPFYEEEHLFSGRGGCRWTVDTRNGYLDATIDPEDIQVAARDLYQQCARERRDAGEPGKIWAGQAVVGDATRVVVKMEGVTAPASGNVEEVA